MQKIRKRSFTSYENSAQLERSLLNEVIQEQITETLGHQNPEINRNFKISGFGLIKSKKARVLSKFQKGNQKTTRDTTQNENVSTIESLKKQVLALECDEIMSYRLQIRKTAHQDKYEQKSNQNQSEIEGIIRRFNTMKRQMMSEKFKRKFLLFNTTKIRSQVKTQRSSIKNDCISVKSDQIILKKKKLQLSIDNESKQLLRKQEYQSQRCKTSMSSTARRFYQKKNKPNRTLTQYSAIYERKDSIKKLKIQKREPSKTVFNY